MRKDSLHVSDSSKLSTAPACGGAGERGSLRRSAAGDRGVLALLRNGNTARAAGQRFYRPEYRHRAGTANSRDRQRHVGDDTAGGGGPTSAKRHLSESWGGDEGVKGRSR